MLALFWLVFWAGLVVLAFAAGVSLRVRLRDHLRPRIPIIDDDALRTILTTGTLKVDEDEPLDIREIDEEERKFWSEPWDEPEEL
jgi:hypothetical protein